MYVKIDRRRIMNTINNLTDLRKSKGLKAEYVSGKLGISRQTLNNKETMRSPVTCSEVTMLSLIYNEPIDNIEKLCRVK